MSEPVNKATTAPPVRSWYAVNRQQEGSSDAEISIYDEIGGWGVSALQFVKELKAIDAKRINLRLNTPGGEVFEATAIHNALREHPAKIIVHVDGLAASAGSFIAMSGDEVRMADNAYMMIHNSRGGVMGDAEDMHAYADVLEKINENIARTYAAKAGKSAKHFHELMDAETWFTAEEAKAEGLVDTVFAPEKQPATARFNLAVYNKIPDPVRQMWGMTPPPAATVIPEPQVNQPAPEGSPRGEPQEPAITQETPTMAETSVQTPPAPTPAAEEAVNVTQGTFATAREAIANFKSVQGPQFFEQGRKQGAEEEAARFNERVNAIVEACPGKPEMALNAIRSGQSPAAVSLAFNATQAAEAKARVDAEEKDRTILRLEALLATGGHPGVGLAVSGLGDDLRQPKRDPKAQAEWEWENTPLVRGSARSKEIYVLARAAELDGTHRTFSRETANA